MDYKVFLNFEQLLFLIKYKGINFNEIIDNSYIILSKEVLESLIYATDYFVENYDIDFFNNNFQKSTPYYLNEINSIYNNVKSLNVALKNSYDNKIIA